MIKLIFNLLKLSSVVRGFKVGQETSEYGLILNQNVSIFGKIIFDKKLKNLTVVKPEMIFENKNQFHYHNFLLVRKYMNKLMFCSTLIILSSFLVCRRSIKITKGLH